MITRLLEPLGFDVREACDGAEAVAIWKQWRPHLIFMDVRMPAMNGLEATRQIRSDPDGQSTIIIAATASSFEEDRAGALLSGCSDYMRKPLEERTLFELLRVHLGVRFAYGETQHGAVAAGADETEKGLKKKVASLPPPLRAALHSALLELDTEAVSLVLNDIQAYDPITYSALQALSENYQYGRLLRIIESSPEPKGAHELIGTGEEQGQDTDHR